MQIIGGSAAYDCRGASLLTDVADYLAGFLGPLSPVNVTVEVTSLHQSKGPPRLTLETLAERFAGRWDRLPLLRYRSKGGTIRLEYASQLSAEAMFNFRDPPDPQFATLLDELLDAINRSFSSSGAISGIVDLAALQSALKSAADEAPRTPDRAATLLRRIRSESEARRLARTTVATASDDLSRFDDRAAELLEDPFFWDPVDDDAPHGNDAGADLLSAFRVWRPRHRAQSPVQFLKSLLQQWGADDQADTGGQLGAMRTQTEIALAFAQIKVEGRCDGDAAAIALAAIDRRLADVSGDQTRAKRYQQLRDKVVSVVR